MVTLNEDVSLHEVRIVYVANNNLDLQFYGTKRFSKSKMSTQQSSGSDLFERLTLWVAKSLGKCLFHDLLGPLNMLKGVVNCAHFYMCNFSLN